jgi:hypothetical protein
MKAYTVMAVAAAGLSAACLATLDKLAANQATERFAQMKPICEQVITCGTKNGKVKEYPTPCDARDDGATDIHPKTGNSCEAIR